MLKQLPLHQDCVVDTRMLCADACHWMPKVLDDESVDLFITDPPYFKVINQKWDYKWRTIDEYLEWCELWISILSQKIRYGGSWYLFGYFRNLASIVPIAEKYGFALRQQVILDKGMQSVAGRKTSTYKMFPNVTESVLFFVKDNRKIIKPILKQRAEELGLKAKEINERLGVKSNGGGMWSIYTGKNICEQFPTRKTWEKLMMVLEMERPYDQYAQTFNNIKGITDVWTDINFYFKNRIHPTEKPFSLIERLILSSSNKGDLVVDPFSGSGVTALSAAVNGRRSVSFEVDDKYFSASVQRLADNDIIAESTHLDAGSL